MDCTNKNCPAYAKCLAPYRGSRCKATRATYGLGDPLTNYDLLIRKTPEELAEWITELTDCTVYPHTRKDAPCVSIGQTCAASWLDWLKQEAKE